MIDEFSSSSALAQALTLLARPTPLNRDCGRLCAARCCAEDEQTGRGMLLYPGEEARYDPLPAGFEMEDSDQVIPGSRMLVCQGTCCREERPLSCRVFPLLFVLNKEGLPDVRLDPRAWPVCPLMSEGLSGLSEGFVKAAREAAGILCGDPEQRAFIAAQQELAQRAQRSIPLLEGLA